SYYLLDKMSGDHSTTTKKKDSIYRIEICQDGKFAVTFDTENLRIKILENTDHRQFILYNDSNNKNNKDESDESDEIAKTIAYFKINNDFDIDKFYDIDYTPPPFVESLYSSNSKDDEYIDYTPPPFVGSLDSSNSKDDDKDNTSPPSVGSLEKEFRWSFDISNMYKKSDDKDFKYFVLVAVSRIKVDEDMKGEKFEYRLEDKDTATIDIEKELDDRKKGIAISKKEFKCELENEDTKFDTTIDVEEHKSEELDDRT
ncbi:14166_t:CDS:2, partial [Rhizophagus irregularis]